MRNLALSVAYDGTGFNGFQVQPGQRTVQGVLQEALGKLEGLPEGSFPNVVGSGRTDSGVHALGQVVSFRSSRDLPDGAYLRGLNSLLPEDLVVRDVVEVPPDFNARKSAKAKEYHYWLQIAPPKLPLGFKAYEVYGKVDLDAIQEAIGQFVGTYDFAGFMATGSSIVNTVRTIYDTATMVMGSYAVFAFIADGFLYNMIRIIMGTLLDVGLGKIAPSEIKGIIESRDRLLAGPTLGPEGLYLYKVYYAEGLGLHSFKPGEKPRCNLDIVEYFT